jgi:hypothetical protein
VSTQFGEPSCANTDVLVHVRNTKANLVVVFIFKSPPRE